MKGRKKTNTILRSVYKHLMGHQILYPSHEFFATGISIVTTIIILFLNLNKNVKETKNSVLPVGKGYIKLYQDGH